MHRVMLHRSGEASMISDPPTTANSYAPLPRTLAPLPRTHVHLRCSHARSRIHACYMLTRVSNRLSSSTTVCLPTCLGARRICTDCSATSRALPSPMPQQRAPQAYALNTHASLHRTALCSCQCHASLCTVALCIRECLVQQLHTHAGLLLHAYILTSKHRQERNSQ